MPEQFWVTGADGKEYGPTSPEVVGQWIRERRIIATTRVRRGDGPSMEAGQVPELAGYFGATSFPAAPATGAPLLLPAEFRVWEFIGRGWDLVKPHWLVLGAMFFIQVAIGSVPYVGPCVQFIIGGAIMVGIWRAILGMVHGRPPTVGMMFEGFDRFGDAFLWMLVSCILIFLGFLALIVPGIILAIMWIFSAPILGETQLGFWEAMRRSAQLTEGYRWRLFLLGLACIPVLILGFLALCVGVFVAQAVCVTAFALAYRFLQQKRGWVVSPAAPSGPAA